MRKRRGKTSRSSRAKTKTRYVFPLVLFLVIAIFVGKPLLSTIKDSNILGIASYLAKGGDSDDDDGDSGSGSSGSGGGGGSGSSGSTSTEDKDDEDEEIGIRTEIETKADEARTEVRFSEEERIRVRTKDGRTRIDITSGGVKTRLEIRDDRVVIKAEQEDGGEVELPDDTIFKIEERLGRSNIKIATVGGEFVIQRASVSAQTNFPLSIDLATNTLTINTPAGSRQVTVLPDQAVQNLLVANVVNRIGRQSLIDAIQTGVLASPSGVITLGEQNGVPVYEIAGVSAQRLLGFIPVSIERTVSVSAQTGGIVSTQQSLFDRVVDVFSF